jgi:hypothetical protein
VLQASFKVQGLAANGMTAAFTEADMEDVRALAAPERPIPAVEPVELVAAVGVMCNPVVVVCQAIHTKGGAATLLLGNNLSHARTGWGAF